MLDQRRNPCERLQVYVCAQDSGIQCTMYTDILRESVEDGSKEMRGQIRSQCLTRINHLMEEEGAKIP